MTEQGNRAPGRTGVGRILTTATLLALGACAGSGGTNTSDGGPPTAPGPETVELYCSTLYDTFAQRYADCHKAPLALATDVIDTARLCAGMVYAVNGGSATYDRNASGKCLDFFETASCADLQGYRDDVVYVPGCQEAVVGKGSSSYPFAYCKTDYECTSGRCHSGGDTGCSSTCAMLYGVGAHCWGDRDCEPGLYCYRGSLWPNTTCQPYSNRPDEGQDCSASTPCKPGLYCTGSFGTCARQITSGACPAGNGKAMAPGFGCFGGVAQPLVGPSEPCVTTADYCGPGLYCGSGSVCVQEPLVGERCVYANGEMQGCVGGYCDAVSHNPATCVTDYSGICYVDLDCKSFGYCDAGCQTFCIQP